MKTFTVRENNIDSRAIAAAADALAAGKIIIYPTDTRYALGCNALDKKAVARLCRLKGLDPGRNTLTIVCSSISMAADYARIDNRTYDILRRNLPGPFTFILPGAPSLPRTLRERRNVGIRVPANAVSAAITEALGNPLMSTSVPDADDGSAPDAAIAAMLYDGVSEVALAIDSGNTPYDSHSAVVDITDASNPKILREGPEELN